MTDAFKSLGLNVAIIGLVVVFAVLWRNNSVDSAKREVRTAMEDSIRNAPITVRRETTVVTLRMPPETVTVHRLVPVRESPPKPSGDDCDSLRWVIATFSDTASVIFPDSEKVSYYPPSGEFTRIERPLKSEVLISTDSTRTVLAEPTEKSWYLRGEGGTGGNVQCFGASLGWKSFDLGWEKVGEVNLVKAGFILWL